MRKMDEMEKSQALQAIRITFLYSMIFEIGYWMIECIRAKTFVTQNSVMFFLIITQGVVLIFSQAFFKKRVGDSKGVLVLLIAFACAMIALAVGFLLMKLGG